MTREEFLLEKYHEMKNNYVNRNKEFYLHPAIARIDPFKMADGLYYVGDRKVCIHLIDTGDGMILLDSGFPGAVHLLVDSIWRAGFDPKKVRWILHSHGHSDHYGASEEFRIMYGTKLAISRVEAENLRKKDKNCLSDSGIPDFDYEIEDGESFELGNVKIRCVLTPGHTAGVLSFFFEVTDGGNTYLAGMFGGAGVNALTLPYIYQGRSPKDAPQQMLQSLKKIEAEPVVVHLGNHPYNNNTILKREQQLKEGGNPFIAPDSWHDFLSKQKVKVEKIIRDNDDLKKEMDQICIDLDGICAK